METRAALGCVITTQQGLANLNSGCETLAGLLTVVS
jgi:hypothetical protein